MAKVLDAGVDSVRVSLNSVVESTYHSYYRPKTYKFSDVVKSIELIKKAGVFLQLNLLTYPGVNDRATETSALLDFIEEYKVDLIQMRNLNIDGELLMSHLQLKPDEIHGIKNMMKLIKKRRPEIQFGYFNRMKKDFYKETGYPNLKQPKK